MHMPPDPEQQRRSMEDPEITDILSDPALQEVLKQIQSNPQESQRYLNDPAVRDKLDTLIAAGVIRLGYTVCSNIFYGLVQDRLDFVCWFCYCCSSSNLYRTLWRSCRWDHCFCSNNYRSNLLYFSIR